MHIFLETFRIQTENVSIMAKPTKTASKPREAAFSLYETLIVVAIISVATALLVPSAQRGRQMANSVKCMSQLRQWGIAFQMHAAEHNGRYPLSWLNNSDNWTLWMAPYVDSSWLSYEGYPTYAKRLDVNKCGCPFYARLQHPNPLFRKFPYSYNAGRFDYPYSYPQHIRGQMIENDVIYASGWDVSDSNAAGISARYGTAGTFGIMWGGEDGNPYIEHFASVPPTVLYKEPAESEVMFCGWAAHWRYMAYPYIDFMCSGDGSDYNVRTGSGQYMTDYNQAPQAVHNGRDNYLMMDGHVESLAPKNPLVNFYVFNDIPARGNPWRNFKTAGSDWQYPTSGVIPKGIDPYP